MPDNNFVIDEKIHCCFNAFGKNGCCVYQRVPRISDCAAENHPCSLNDPLLPGSCKSEKKRLCPEALFPFYICGSFITFGVSLYFFSFS